MNDETQQGTTAAATAEAVTGTGTQPETAKRRYGGYTDDEIREMAKKAKTLAGLFREMGYSYRPASRTRKGIAALLTEEERSRLSARRAA